MGLDNPVHILIILCVVLLLFGAKRLPEMGKGLGQGMREFKESITAKSPEAVTASAGDPMKADSLEPSEQAVGATRT